MNQLIKGCYINLSVECVLLQEYVEVAIRHRAGDVIFSMCVCMNYVRILAGCCL